MKASLACISALALLWLLDVAAIECRHATIRRMMRDLRVSWAARLEYVSAEFILARQRILEARSGLRRRRSAKAKVKARAKVMAKARARGKGRPKANAKAKSKLKARGGRGQRALMSLELRNVDKSAWQNRKRLFTEINKTYRDMPEQQPAEFQRLQEIGERAVRARAAGGTAFGPTASRSPAARPPLPPRDSDASLELIAPISLNPGSVLALQRDASEEDAMAVHNRHLMQVAADDERTQATLDAWQTARLDDLHGIDTGIFQDALNLGATPVPAVPAGIDMLEWIPPGKELVERCLAQRKTWKEKGRQKEDIEFHHRMLRMFSQRHVPMQHLQQPKLLRWTGPKLKLCFTVGFCVCGLLSLRQFVVGFQRMIMAALQKGSVARENYDKGALILGIKALATSSHWFHISWGNLNTRHFTLARLKLSHAPSRIDVAQSLGSCIPIELDGDPVGLTMWETFRMWDHSLSYTCRFHKLFENEAVVPDFVIGKNIFVERLPLSDTFTAYTPRKPPPRPPRRRAERGAPRRRRPRSAASHGPDEHVALEDGVASDEEAANEDDDDEPDQDAASEPDALDFCGDDHPPQPDGPDETGGRGGDDDADSLFDGLAADMEVSDDTHTAVARDMGGIWDTEELGVSEDEEGGCGGDQPASPSAPDPDVPESACDIPLEAPLPPPGLPSPPPPPPPPPPSPPPAAGANENDDEEAAHAEPGARHRGGPIYGRIPLPDGNGYFKYDIAQESLNLHCCLPGHGEKCRANRKTTRLRANRSNKAQGRAIGMQLAWLKAAVDNPELFPDAATHGDLKLHKNKGSPYLHFDIRKQQREWAHTCPSLVEIWTYQRDPDSDEDSEPEGVA